LLQIELHWTAQLQNQQQRIATLLSVSGLLFGFAAFLPTWSKLQGRHWPVVVYGSSLVVLCIGLFLGIFALAPHVPIAAPLWLDQSKFLRRSRSSPAEDAFLEEVCDDAVENHSEIRRALVARRRLMYGQVAALLVSLTLLVVALLGSLESAAGRPSG
jgi:hypothetical protein